MNQEGFRVSTEAFHRLRRIFGVAGLQTRPAVAPVALGFVEPEIRDFDDLLPAERPG